MADQFKIRIQNPPDWSAKEDFTIDSPRLKKFKICSSFFPLKNYVCMQKAGPTNIKLQSQSILVEVDGSFDLLI